MSTNFGELVLVLGDSHIPYCTKSIPEKFLRLVHRLWYDCSVLAIFFLHDKNISGQRMLVPNKCQHILCTGNLGSFAQSDREQYEFLRSLAPNVHCVSGSNQAMMTTANEMISFPETKIVQIGEFRIGLIHGHQIIPWGDHSSLGVIRRKLNVDVLIFGHTHQNEVVEYDGFYHINPGSITGAFSSCTATVIPSFILLAVQGNKMVCYVYELIDDEVEVSKTEFSKKPAT